MATRDRLDSRAVVSRLRNDNNRSSALFLQNQIGEGTLNANSIVGSPPSFPIIRTGGRKPVTGITRLGSGVSTSKEFIVAPKLSRFLPNTQYNPFVSMHEAGEVSGQTMLTKNIPLGTYLSGETQKTNFDNIKLQDLGEMLKYAYVQAEMLKAARSRPEFQGYDIKVEDGIYVYEDVETRTAGDLADYGAYARAISYTVKYFKTGETDILKTFQLAEYWAGLPWYGKIQVDYYTFEGDTKIRTFLILPELNNAYNGNWTRRLNTSFNLKTMSETLLLLDIS